MQVHEVRDLFLVELVELLPPLQLLLVGGRTGVADKTEDGVLEVALRPEVVDFSLVLERPPQEIHLLG